MSDNNKLMTASKERIKPKRREMNPKRRNTPVRCVDCPFYTPIDQSPCLWKLEAQLDAAQQHINIAVSLIRKMTNKKWRRTLRYWMQPQETEQCGDANTAKT